MKKYLINLLIPVTLLSCYSCADKFQEVNIDPLAATSAAPNAVLPYVFAEYSARHTTELGTRLSDVPYYLSDTFNSPKNGGSTSGTLANNTWNVFYSSILGNLLLLERDAVTAGPTSNNIQAIAKIFKAHVFFELTSIWEEVPFTQALNEEFPFPEFDDQQTVLEGVISLCDEAIALLDGGQGSFNFSSGDLLLGGDEDAWRAFAVGIKIRSLMLIRNVPTEEASAETRLIAAFGTGNQVVTGPIEFKYPGGAGARNGWNELLNLFGSGSNEGDEFWSPSQELIAEMLPLNDPRLSNWFTDLSETGTYPAPEYDQFPNGLNDAVVGDQHLRGTLPHIFMQPGEFDFYEAELLLDGVALNTGNTAQEAFENGITNTLEYYGGGINGFVGTPTTNTQITDYITAVGAVTLQKVHIQLWLEGFLRPIIGWNHVRRTNTPALPTPPNSAITSIIKRFNYPSDEISANPNVPANLPIDDKMWFEN